MAFNVQLTASAQSDIEETMDFLSERTPAHASRWFEGLFEAMETLREMPARQGLIAEAGRLKRPLRVLPYAAHRVIYEVDDAQQIVFIVRIYHSSRAPLQAEDVI